jgi:hypothetical protein
MNIKYGYKLAASPFRPWDFFDDDDDDDDDAPTPAELLADLLTEDPDVLSRDPDIHRFIEGLFAAGVFR